MARVATYPTDFARLNVDSSFSFSPFHLLIPSLNTSTYSFTTSKRVHLAMRPNTSSSLVSLFSRNLHLRNTRNDLSRLSPHSDPFWILWPSYRTTPKLHACARTSLSRLRYINASLGCPRIHPMMIMVMPQPASHCIHLTTDDSSHCSRQQPILLLFIIIRQITSTHRNKT